MKKYYVVTGIDRESGAREIINRVDDALLALGHPSAAHVENAVKELMTNLVFLCMHHSYNIDPEAVFNEACDAYEQN